MDLLESAVLIRRQELVHVKQHQRTRLVQVGAGRFYLVHVPHDEGFVGARSNELRQLFLESIKLGLLLTQLRQRRLEDAVHARDLLDRQRQLLLDRLVLPPRRRRRSIGGRSLLRARRRYRRGEHDRHEQPASGDVLHREPLKKACP